MVTRRRLWALLAAGLLASYAAAGFWGVPWLAKRSLASYARDQLQRQAGAAEVSFNPFTLRLEAWGISLAEANGDPLVGADRLMVHMQWRSLATAAWRFSDIELDAPSVRLVIAPDGRFNIADLIAAATRGSQPTPNASLPRLAIDRLAVRGGRVEMQDRHAGYANTLTPIDFEVAGFSTLPDRKDEYTLAARSRSGAVVRWKGRSSMNPMRADGEIAIDDASLPELSVYVQSQAGGTLASGKLSATLPYTVSYADGRLDALLVGARIAARELSAVREGQSQVFATLAALSVPRLDAQFTALSGGAWNASVSKLELEGTSLAATHEGVKLTVASAAAQLTASAAQQDGSVAMKVGGAALSLGDVAVSRGAQAQKFAKLGLEGADIDLASRTATVQRVYAEGGQLRISRDRKGTIDVASWVPTGNAPAPAKAGQPWAATVRTVDVTKVDAEVADETSGVSLHLADAHARLEGAGTDTRQPMKFTAGVAVREGGQLDAEGSAVPATGAMSARIKATRLALKPVQPLLAQYLKLKVASGALSAQGKLATGSGKPADPALRYEGSFNVDGLVIRELDNDVFASWRSFGAARLTASVTPNRLDVPELRIVGADAKLIIEDDRSFNAARLLVKQDTAPPPAPAASAPSGPETFPVRVRRVRIQDAKLDFTDLSLRPQFAAKIHELNGVVNGLSTSRTARAQIELDGRVDEFGEARIRGETSLAAPKDNTDVNFVFRNVDMVPASPYSMKFAGYRIAEGKISLDLQYKIRANKLEGDNKIVIDRLTLGERVESPDALKLPLALAIAVLKDSDGRIDLGLPVTGDLSDPQFSYGGIIWKAIVNVITKIVTAPFRALGAVFGGDGAKLEAIDFDAGSGKLSPPEREKLQQVAQILAKRAALKLSVPGQYSPTADGAALRALALRRDVAQRTGTKLEEGEQPGPFDLGDRNVRSALRDLYAQRFGDAELDKAKKAAEAAPAAPGPASQASQPSQAPLPLWQRAAKMIQGEPQVADASAFYAQLRERLEREHPLPADALPQLGAARARAIAESLTQAGVDASRVAVGSPEAVDSPAGKTVGLKLGLAAR